MIWTQTINPRVWKGGALHIAMAVDNTEGLEGGCVACIHKSDYPLEVVPGTARWGRTFTAALTRAVKTFDPEATLPE